MIPDHIDPEDVAEAVHKLAEMEDASIGATFGGSSEPLAWIVAARSVCERALRSEAETVTPCYVCQSPIEGEPDEHLGEPVHKECVEP